VNSHGLNFGRVILSSFNKNLSVSSYNTNVLKSEQGEDGHRHGRIDVRFLFQWENLLIGRLDHL